ncbi:MAG: D-alanyl-D-alanine carboxypeptidase [Chloroflexi bacterium]|nr:D-alanyl-D-alanine carboxypeptidase [Chloroflexota bacterium]MBV9603158.1 D-alanyl-D-alanine carboxypeptidase [Chloroflexota bacterium]
MLTRASEREHPESLRAGAGSPRRTWGTRGTGTEVLEAQEGPVRPIFVNDNLLDIIVSPAAVGQTAHVEATPVTSAFRIASEVTTSMETDTSISVVADPADAHHLVVSGTIGAAAGRRLTVYRIQDAASWARTLFIEALIRAGVRVAANPMANNPSS